MAAKWYVCVCYIIHTNIFIRLVLTFHIHLHCDLLSILIELSHRCRTGQRLLVVFISGFEILVHHQHIVRYVQWTRLHSHVFGASYVLFLGDKKILVHLFQFLRFHSVNVDMDVWCWKNIWHAAPEI